MARIEVREFQDEAALSTALPERSVLVLFDERGDNIDSRTFSTAVLQRHAVSGGGAPLVFAIGGADGHTDVLRSRASRSLAFGKLTIAHRLVRLLVLEQIYRGLSIIAGMPYHRD